MEKEFIKCEVNFKFKDGDFITETARSYALQK